MKGLSVGGLLGAAECRLGIKIGQGVHPVNDDMFFSKDERSLSRGSRVAKRTETCRPCLIQIDGENAPDIQGVAMDMTPYGLLVRTMEPIPVSTEVTIQLMRDDSFRKPFSSPLNGSIVRHEEAPGGFIDHGVTLKVDNIRRTESRPPTIKPSAPARPRRPSKMHTIDFTIGGPGADRPRR